MMTDAQRDPPDGMTKTTRMKISAAEQAAALERAPPRRRRRLARRPVEPFAPFFAAVACFGFSGFFSRISDGVDLDLVAVLVVGDERRTRGGRSCRGGGAASSWPCPVQPSAARRGRQTRRVSDPVFDVPRERELTSGHGSTSLALLRRRDFRTLFLAVSTSELGDALSYIALMWLALDAGGALGVVAVRLADSLPAFFFGLHGGIAADRWSRRRLMIGADVVRAATLIPLAIAGPLRVAAAVGAHRRARSCSRRATSYFAPAYGATIPVVVDRANVQQANALVHATAQALSVGGWALAALMLQFVPVSTFFADRRGDVPRLGRAAHAARRRSRPRRRGRVDRAARRHRRAAPAPRAVARGDRVRDRDDDHDRLLDRRRADARPRHARPRPGRLLARDGRLRDRRRSATGIVLTRIGVRSKARASMLAWTIYLPAYGLIAVAGSLPLVAAAAIGTGAGETHLVRAAQLGGAGGGAGPRARPRARRDLVRPPRRARDRAAAGRAAVRGRVGAAAVRRGGGGDDGRRARRRGARDADGAHRPRRAGGVGVTDDERLAALRFAEGGARAARAVRGVARRLPEPRRSGADRDDPARRSARRAR